MAGMQGQAEGIIPGGATNPCGAAGGGSGYIPTS